MAEETAEELYDQRKSVLELANRFETGQGQRDASPLKSYDKEGPSGRQLLEQMRITCKVASMLFFCFHIFGFLGHYET